MEFYEWLILKSNFHRVITTIKYKIFFSFLGVGWDWVHLVRRPIFALLYQPCMIDDECWVVGGMRIGRGYRSTQRIPVPVPLSPPKFPHDLTWDRTRAAAVGSWRLTSWAMAYLKLYIYIFYQHAIWYTYAPSNLPDPKEICVHKKSAKYAIWQLMWNVRETIIIGLYSMCHATCQQRLTLGIVRHATCQQHLTHGNIRHATYQNHLECNDTHDELTAEEVEQKQGTEHSVQLLSESVA
jgi:hypothetical protein